jgi:hypothetical protein
MGKPCAWFDFGVSDNQTLLQYPTTLSQGCYSYFSPSPVFYAKIKQGGK